MVLTIDGIQKMNHNILCGREIVHIASEQQFGKWYYIFYFDELPMGKNDGSVTKWENRFDIRLGREPNNGIYELYWMGLHGVTCQHLNIKDVKNFSIFYNYFVKVVQLGKTYWEESKTYRS